jgi:hypothetical protein
MSSFDEKDDSILEIPLFLRIQTKTKTFINKSETNDNKTEEFLSISTITKTELKSDNKLIDETFTIDDDSDDNKSLRLSPIDVSNDSIQVLSYSPNTQNRDSNDIEEDNEWSDCKTSSDTSSPIKAVFINRTPFLKNKNKTPLKKSVKNNNKSQEMIINRMAQKEERKRIRDQKKAEKEMTKIREKANKEVLKSKGFKESLKYCFAIIHIKLYEMCEQSIDEIFAQREANYRLTDSPLVPLSVTWIRKHLNLTEEPDSNGLSSQASVTDYEVPLNHILVFIETNVFIERVHAFVTQSGETLFDFVKNIKLLSNKNNVTLLVYQLDQYFRRQKSKSQNQFRQRFNELYSTETTSQPIRRQNKCDSLPSVTKEDIDLALIDLELKLMQIDTDFKVSLIKVNDSSELATLIFRYTRSVAESLSRNEKNLQQNFCWFADADNRNTVDPIDDRSHEKLWQKQLMQFPKISKDIANAIIFKYPTPKCLLETYSRVTQPELLLADIVVARTQPNGKITERKIGRELSTRVHLFMTSRNGDQLLSQ